MELVSADYDVLGTKLWIYVVGKNPAAKESIEKAFLRAKEIEKKYSRFIKGNILADLNAKVGEWQTVDEETYALLKFGEDLNKKTQGVFDLSVKGILESLGYDENYSFEERGEGSLGKMEFSADGKVKINAQIEFGGIGKGYAVDEMAKILAEFPGYFINAGGDIFAKGLNEKGEKWKVYFEHPLEVEKMMGYTEVDEKGMGFACSSPTKRQWAGKHHLIDPRTKKPADKMLAVYTQAKNCFLADAYSTPLFVMGYDEAKKNLDDFPVEAMLVDVSGAIYRSGGFKGELFK